ncbi:MAG: GNAT family N-acetyltransferase [Clostridia bacterium]|nr:GNAT family N-acetyltransferase [Clostridia bacterium]
MATEMYWAKAQEKREIVEFIDYVFSKAHRPHDFQTLLPKLYGAQGDGAAHHFVVREEGRIAATVLAYPVVMHMGGVQLTTLGVGSVSTHPAARGRGYMKALMDAVDRKAAELGADFAVLGGLRQRYAYFGYDLGGYSMDAVFTPDNARHALRDLQTDAYAVVPMEAAHVPAASALLRAQPCFCERREEAFLDILRSWNNEPFAVLKDGAFAGYGALRQNPDQCRVAELLLEDEAALPAVMKLLGARHGEMRLTAAPWQKERAAWLSSVCEAFSIVPGYNYKIYRQEQVKKACAALGAEGGGFGFGGFSLPLPLYVAPPDAV